MMLTVVPAYGRDYKNKKDVLPAWESNADFQIADITSQWDGSYVNLGDLRIVAGVNAVKIRYNGLRKLVLIIV